MVKTVNVTADELTPVEMALGQELEHHVGLYEALLAYDIPVVAAYWAGGYWGVPEQESLTVGGVAIEYRGTVDTESELPTYKHHFYVFEPGASFDAVAQYSEATAGLDRLGSDVAFMEFVLVSEKLFMQGWEWETNFYYFFDGEQQNPPWIELARANVPALSETSFELMEEPETGPLELGINDLGRREIAFHMADGELTVASGEPHPCFMLPSQFALSNYSPASEPLACIGGLVAE